MLWWALRDCGPSIKPHPATWPPSSPCCLQYKKKKNDLSKCVPVWLQTRQRRTEKARGGKEIKNTSLLLAKRNLNELGWTAKMSCDVQNVFFKHTEAMTRAWWIIMGEICSMLRSSTQLGGFCLFKYGPVPKGHLRFCAWTPVRWKSAPSGSQNWFKGQ